MILLQPRSTCADGNARTFQCTLTSLGRKASRRRVIIATFLKKTIGVVWCQIETFSENNHIKLSYNNTGLSNARPTFTTGTNAVASAYHSRQSLWNIKYFEFNTNNFIYCPYFGLIITWILRFRGSESTHTSPLTIPVGPFPWIAISKNVGFEKIINRSMIHK